ncbi:MAG: alpha/beta hydrolase [Bacteroidota bacterium]
MTKKKIKVPLKLVFIGLLFSKVERIWPWLAHRWFVRIFFSTARFEVPQAERDIAANAERLPLEFGHKRIQVYKWGQGSPVLFVHGWMGRATQFHKFIPVFNQAGYSVIAFDSTGHGLSEGHRSHILEFAGIIKLLYEKYGRFKMVVGHSLGGVASLHAIKDFQVTERLTMIASPAIAQEIVDEFRKKIGASKKCVPYFEKYIFETFGKRFEQYSASNIVSEVKNTALLFIYDRNDREVSMKNPEIMQENCPEAKLIVTKGLGHNRILKDNEVIASTLEFLRSLEPVVT